MPFSNPELNQETRISGGLGGPTEVSNWYRKAQMLAPNEPKLWPQIVEQLKAEAGQTMRPTPGGPFAGVRRPPSFGF